MSTIAPAAAVDVDPSKLPQMMAAVKVLLRGLGEDVTRDGLLRTPLRVAQAFQAAIQGIFNLSHSLPRAADRAFFSWQGFWEISVFSVRIMRVCARVCLLGFFFSFFLLLFKVVERILRVEFWGDAVYGRLDS